MGIVKLLPGLSQACKKIKLEDMAGQRAGIDFSIWLYKGGVHYACQMVDHLRSLGIKVILVLDGAELEAKREVVQDRKIQRRKLALKAQGLHDDGQLEEAAKMERQCYQRTDSDIEYVKTWCRTMNIKFVQSPHEADAQLAYMLRNKLIDVVITEDADLIPYGCDRILFRMNQQQGEGDLFEMENLKHTWVDPYDLDCLRAVCILVGCDYYKGGLRGFGIKKAPKLYRNMGRPFRYEEMVDHLKPMVNQKVDKDAFMCAFNTFQYQLVFDPISRRVVPLTPYPDGKSDKDFPYAGNLAHAEGEFFNPKTEFLPLQIGRPIQETFYCKDCQLSFPTRGAFQDHRSSEHPNICKECGRKFDREAKLVDHMKIHNKEPIKCHVCEVCGEAFVTSKKLEGHMRNHPTEMHMCPVCNREFKRKDTMKKHMSKQHSDEKPFVCGICGTGFKERYTLKIHETTHSDDKPFHCSKCGKRFKNRILLSQHESSHNKGRQFVCSLCGSAYKQKRSLREHEKTHRPEHDSETR